MKVAIHGKSFLPDTLPQIENLLTSLEDKQTEISVSESFFEILANCGVHTDNLSIYKPGAQLSGVHFFISLGGDGTLLQSVTHIGAQEIPILAINLGRLGFLSNGTLEESGQIIEQIMNDDFEIDSRMLIRAECEANIFKGMNFALNEFTILKQDTSSMITVNTYLDGAFFNSYWADGLIIATPTGSTGYSLSCGGPIIYPESHSFIITPVSPHNLNIRPFVVSDKSVITLEVTSRSNYFLVSLDSRSHTVSSGFKFTIKKESFVAKLIKTGSNTFMDTLRKKLNWGLDIRN